MKIQGIRHEDLQRSFFQQLANVAALNLFGAITRPIWWVRKLPRLLPTTSFRVGCYKYQPNWSFADVCSLRCSLRKYSFSHYCSVYSLKSMIALVLGLVFTKVVCLLLLHACMHYYCTWRGLYSCEITSTVLLVWPSHYREQGMRCFNQMLTSEDDGGLGETTLKIDLSMVKLFDYELSTKLPCCELSPHEGILVRGSIDDMDPKYLIVRILAHCNWHGLRLTKMKSTRTKAFDI